MSTKDWFIRAIPLFFALSLLFGWHDWSDHTYLTLIFLGILVVMFEGKFLVTRQGREQCTLLERIAEDQQKNRVILEQLEEEERRDTTLLERLAVEQRT